MDKSFEPATFEGRWYAHWEASGCFKPSGKGQPYTIMLPPPNVTGTLHMGHAFQHTLQDALIRYHRMRGFDTLWQMGSDHAGIATEMVVGRNLARENLTRDGLGRDKFIEKVWEWKQESGDTIERQMRRLGSSGDWSRTVFTMDPMPSKAVVETFVRLFEEGLIYRGQRLVNWDPVLKTAISDLEVVSEEEDGKLWSISYPLADGSGSLVVATTRPETMLGDTAVMVHPADERYAHLVGKTVRLPLSEREIPIISDDYVDREFGTGVVKVTPAHDFNDYAVGQRHGLPLINIFDDSAIIRADALRIDFKTIEHHSESDSMFKLSSSASWPVRSTQRMPERYAGLDRFSARKAVLADLAAAGLLVEEKKHKLQVPRGDRSGQVIEPYLTNQWFVKMDSLAARGLELVENGSVRFVPENWISTYRHWMENIQDWCISRQLWWGHRIPAWFDAQEKYYVGRTFEEANQKFTNYLNKLRSNPEAFGYSNAKPGVVETIAAALEERGLTQETDVLETWFSSALWSHSTLGWPDEIEMAKRGFEERLPTSVLVTGFDIIFFWVARMIMMTDHFMPKEWPDAKRVPFKDVYITGLVRDSHGQKMSKSKGNILDPIDIIDGIGLEALVAKRTTGLMKPTDAPKIEKATRKEFPDGIPAFGADALRFTFASLATHGRDIKFDLNRAEGYKNFCNKLWNAARFVLSVYKPEIEIDETEPLGHRERPDLPLEQPPNWPATSQEKWILSRLNKLSQEVAAQFADYRFDLASQALYEFSWNEFCDWFIELSKPYLNTRVFVDTSVDEFPMEMDLAATNSVRYTLFFVLERTLRLLHPIVPFVTEEIWHTIAPKLGVSGESISTQTYPEFEPLFSDFAKAEAEVEWLKEIISLVRRIRGESNIPPSRKLNVLLGGGHNADVDRVSRLGKQIRFLAKIDILRWLTPGESTPNCTGGVVGDLTVLVPLAGLIDLDAEKTRLDKELARVVSEIAKSEAKLGKFGDKAPAAIVEQERARLTDWSTQLAALTQQRALL